MKRARRYLAVGCVLGAAALSSAHIRLRHPGNLNPLWWADDTNISVVTSSIGSGDIADESEDTALRNAYDAWNDASGSRARLVEDTSAASQARTDWQASDLHLVWWDENDSSGYFPGGSSTVAITPIWFFSNGQIDDADVIFNGKNFAFTTSGEAGRFDVQDVATHELGHFLGLDHSGQAGATMYPFVDSTVILHRSLAQDDVHGLREIYPSSTFATVSGTIRRSSDSTPVAGAHVFARDTSGRTVGATLAGNAGAFVLSGLDAGTYTLHAAPLEYPVSSGNLGAGWTVETDFEPSDLGTTSVTTGQAKSVGDLFVGADVAISLGRNTDRYPLRAPSGQMSIHIARGSGLVAGSTLTCSDPSIAVNPITWFGTQVSFNVTVPGGAAPGHADLIATTPGGDTSILVAGIEITPPDPTVLFVSPNQVMIDGGTQVTLTGTGFNPGARVVVGGVIYEDGVPGGCTVVNSTTLTFTTRQSLPGTSDVVVIDSSGVEGRKVTGLQFLAVPQLGTVFPTAGDLDGGTVVTLTGQNFVDGAVVRIDGVVQTSVSVLSLQRIAVGTLPGTTSGTKVVEIENPGGQVAFGSFTFVNQDDPSIVSVSPGSGSAGGGETVTVRGTNFTPSSTVLFGADPLTGLGGTTAATTFLDAQTLQVVTPGMSSGEASVLVQDSNSGQAELLTSGFNFLGGGGGGGGCGAVRTLGPPKPRDVLGSLFWFAALAWLSRRPLRRARA